VGTETYTREKKDGSEIRILKKRLKKRKKDLRNDTAIPKERLENETCILGGHENKEITGNKDVY